MFKSFSLPRNIPEFIYRVVRGSLYAFTFILWILGLALIVFSFWYIYEGEIYHMDNSIKFIIFTVSFLAGFILLSLSLCGLAGVFKENIGLAKIFLVGMVILMLMEIIFIFLIYAYKKEIMDHSNTLFQKLIRQYADDDEIRSLVDTIQSDLKCCGISSPNDWDRNPYYKCDSISTLACSVPASCCYNFTTRAHINMFCGVGVRRKEWINKQYQFIHVTGCKYSIYSFLDYKHKMTSSILTGVLVPQFIGVILILSFIVSLNHLIEMDSIERELLGCGVVEFRRNQHDQAAEIKAHAVSSAAAIAEPSAPPFELATAMAFENYAYPKQLFALSIGINNDFLRRSSRFYENKAICRDDQEESSPSHKPPPRPPPPPPTTHDYIY